MCLCVYVCVGKPQTPVCYYSCAGAGRPNCYPIMGNEDPSSLNSTVPHSPPSSPFVVTCSLIFYTGYLAITHAMQAPADFLIHPRIVGFAETPLRECIHLHGSSPSKQNTEDADVAGSADTLPVAVGEPLPAVLSRTEVVGTVCGPLFGPASSTRRVLTRRGAGWL